MPAPLVAVCVIGYARLHDHARVGNNAAEHAKGTSSIVTGARENSDRPLAL